MIMPTVSIAKGKGYARHNDRSIKNKSFDERSWNPELSAQNIIYKNEPIRSEYDKVFGEALEKYNQQQIEKGRPDRQIKNYYEKISRSKQEKTSYELIIQIGSMKDKQNPNEYERIQAALDEFNRTFQEKNPNFHVCQQITHRDEEGMDHTHILFFPVSTGNKRGLETKNSLSGALKSMGYDRNGFDQWRESQLNSLREIMKKHELEFELGDGRSEHLNVRQYREFKKYETLSIEKQNTLSELQKSVSEAKIKIDELKHQKNEIDAQIAQKTVQIESLESRKNLIINNPIKTLQDDLNQYIDKTIAIIEKRPKEPIEPDEYVKLQNHEYLDDSMVTIKGLSKNKVEMSLEQWNGLKNKHNKLVDRYNVLVDVYHKIKKELHDFIFYRADRMRTLIDKVAKHPYVKEINMAIDWKNKAIKAEDKYDQLKRYYDSDLEKATREISNKYKNLEAEYDKLNADYKNLEANFDDIMVGTARYIHSIDPEPRHPRLLEDYAKTVDINRKALILNLPKNEQIKYKGFSRDRGIKR